MTKVGNRKMRCPYCQKVFTISQKQQFGNLTFTCPNCHKANQGSVRADENGVLIGERGMGR